MRERALTPEERALWQQATRHDAKFHPQDAPEHAEAAPALHPTEPAPPRSTATHKSHDAPAARPAQAPVVMGNLTRMDGLNARRFKRGEWTIDCALDLHGYTRVEAFAALARTVRTMAQRGERVLAVITGKGSRSSTQGSEGVLKREVPHWLNDPAIRPYVVAATHPPKHLGGEGAVLVLIKRPRI